MIYDDLKKGRCPPDFEGFSGLSMGVGTPQAMKIRLSFSAVAGTQNVGLRSTL